MKLVATFASDTATKAFTFTEPGGIMGRCPGNHLLLNDDASVGRIQAVVRIQDQDCSLMNVSSQTQVTVNGRPLPLLQETPLVPGDVLVIGAYTIQAESGPAREPEASEVATQAETTDIFKELLEGPGVVPVGQAVAAALHPFDLESQAPRNHPDPISQIVDDSHPTLNHAEITRRLFSAESEGDDHPLFSNTSPSTLTQEDPLAAHRHTTSIDTALAQGHARSPLYENW